MLSFCGFVFAVLCFISFANGEPPIYASEIRMCENKTYPVSLQNIKLRVKGDIQEIKMKIVLTRNLDDEFNYVIAVDKIIGTKAKKLINMKNKGPCTALITYGGEPFLGGVRQAKFPHPDKCPLEKGTYNLDWYKINFDSIPLVKLVPKGKFQLTIQAIDVSTAKQELCVVLVVEKN